MTEQAQEVEQEAPKINLDDYILKSEAAANEAGLKISHDKLLTEKKAEQAKKEAAQEKARLTAEEAAKKNGDTESLLKSWAEKEKSYQDKLNELTTKESNRIKNDSARDLATKLADGANAKLLERFISDRLKYDNGEIKVLDKSGNLTVSSLDDLQKEFESNADFNALLRGSKASGSGASKSKSGGAGSQTITQEQFNDMSHLERSKFFNSGGEVA